MKSSNHIFKIQQLIFIFGGLFLLIYLFNYNYKQIIRNINPAIKYHQILCVNKICINNTCNEFVVPQSIEITIIKNSQQELKIENLNKICE